VDPCACRAWSPTSSLALVPAHPAQRSSSPWSSLTTRVRLGAWHGSTPAARLATSRERQRPTRRYAPPGAALPGQGPSCRRSGLRPSGTPALLPAVGWGQERIDTPGLQASRYTSYSNMRSLQSANLLLSTTIGHGYGMRLTHPAGRPARQTPRNHSAPAPAATLLRHRAAGRRRRPSHHSRPARPRLRRRHHPARLRPPSHQGRPARRGTHRPAPQTTQPAAIPPQPGRLPAATARLGSRGAPARLWRAGLPSGRNLAPPAAAGRSGRRRPARQPAIRSPHLDVARARRTRLEHCDAAVAGREPALGCERFYRSHHGLPAGPLASPPVPANRP